MEFDAYKQYWKDQPEELKEILDEARDRVATLNSIIDEFERSPNERRSEIMDMAFGDLGAVLFEITPPCKRKDHRVITEKYRPDDKIYRCADGSIKMLRAMITNKAIDDDVQDFLGLYRTDLWKVSVEAFAMIEDPAIVALSADQLVMMRKAKLIDPLSEIEEKLINHPGLFDLTPGQLRKSVGGKLKGRAWVDFVTRTRALAIALGQRGTT